MADLIAQGKFPQQRWRKRLVRSQAVVLGRSAGSWSVPWDEHISRRHVELSWNGTELSVARLTEGRNPIYFTGAACERCTLRPGQMFVLGGTTFTVIEEPATVSVEAPLPAIEHTFSLDVLQRAAFRDANQRIEVLGRLPEILAGDVSSDEDLAAKTVSLLQAGISQASYIAVVRLDDSTAGPGLEILHADQVHTTATEEIRPSERLVRKALGAGCSTAHVWSPSATDSVYTQAESVAWAFCTPLRQPASRNWSVYAAGKLRGDGRLPEYADLQDEVKFTEIVADAIGRVRELRRLERRQAALGQFVSNVVLDRLGTADAEEALAPRETEVTVMFCDLRGFSRAAERAAQELMALLERVSLALGVTTREILATGGVIGDFHGDAAMGFWGWPFEQPDRVARACQAALAIRAEFQSAANTPGHRLAGFRMGIGVASGRAVAGRIGTTDQVKVTAFGPVVNLASRLQDLTKILSAPILLDENTAAAVRSQSPAVGRLRRVARVRPRGLDSPLWVSQLLPAHGDPLTDRDIALYEQALAALTAGEFEEAFTLLHGVTAADRVKDFLTVFIAQNHRQPPAGWDGVIDLSGT